MGSINRVFLVGHLGKDAEVRYTPGGDAVATLNLATSEQWKDKSGQKQERTEWHRVIVWGKAAESLSSYLTKGKQIGVEGKLQTRMWEKDGTKHYTTEIKSDRITLLGAQNGSGGERSERQTPSARTSSASEPSGFEKSSFEEAVDDIPF